MKKPLAIGIDSFRRIREDDYYYIDKTLMIQDFLEFRQKVALITRPRRFGKTLNMTMLREFFDITKDSKDIFAGLRIMDTEYKSQINSMPVIFLTLKNCSGNTHEEIKESLAETIREEYMRYVEIFGKAVDKESPRYIMFYRTYEALLAGEISESLLKNSLSELIKAVSLYYGRTVLVLIDEYDQPLIKAHEKCFRSEFTNVYGGFLGKALKGNEYLGQALLTGIQRVAKESIFSELNNFLVYTVLSKKYSPYFGLTTEETRQALQDYGEELSEEIRSYYDGYMFGEINMYNPWSILCYLNEHELRPYWINTSTNALVRELIPKASRDFLTAFEELILDGEVEVAVNLEASFLEMANTGTLWGLLINAGYLTGIRSIGAGELILRIPNNEVKSEFRSIVASYLQLGGDELNQLFNALQANNMERFLNLYQKLIYRYVSVHDIKENGYHMLFLGMAISVSGMYRITSNQEAGDGRPDIVMESLQPIIRPHVVFEFKQGENVEKLKQQALEQILEKKYYANLTGKVLCVGLAHSQKKCELVYEKIEVE